MLKQQLFHLLTMLCASNFAWAQLNVLSASLAWDYPYDCSHLARGLSSSGRLAQACSQSTPSF